MNKKEIIKELHSVLDEISEQEKRISGNIDDIYNVKANINDAYKKIYSKLDMLQIETKKELLMLYEGKNES